MDDSNRARVEALASELRRQSHDFKRGKQPPFVGPCDTPSAVFIQGCIDLESLVAALVQSADHVPA